MGRFVESRTGELVAAAADPVYKSEEAARAISAVSREARALK